MTTDLRKARRRLKKNALGYVSLNVSLALDSNRPFLRTCEQGSPVRSNLDSLVVWHSEWSAKQCITFSVVDFSVSSSRIKKFRLSRFEARPTYLHICCDPQGRETAAQGSHIRAFKKTHMAEMNWAEQDAEIRTMKEGQIGALLQSKCKIFAWWLFFPCWGLDPWINHKACSICFRIFHTELCK